MIRPRGGVPSLGALAVFEAAARLMSFSAAARERNVTQAAVSKRVQQLERDLGIALFVREGRRLKLTREGELLFARVSSALDFLGEGIAALKGDAPTPSVTIAAAHSVSHFWLGRLLSAFMCERPDIGVSLTTSDRRAEVDDAESDLAILYGYGAHPRWRLSKLFDEELVPMAAPSLMQRFGLSAATPDATLAAAPLLRYGRLDARWRTLEDWFVWRGIGAPRAGGVSYSSYPMAVAAAVRGEGVVLGSAALLGEECAAGVLGAVSDAVWRTGNGYHLALRRGEEASQGALALHQFLLGAAET